MSFDRITTIFSSLAALAVIHCISTVLYNLFWSPLSAVPGPRWYAATPFPRLWLYFSGREPWAVKEMHERYGPIVRLAPYEVSFIDEKAWPEIYGYKAATHKDETFYPFSPATKNSLILASDENHHRMRKMFLPAFSARALRDQSELLDGYVTRLVKVLGSRIETDDVVDLVKMYNLTTYVSALQDTPPAKH
jgi:cytochrome P450